MITKFPILWTYYILWPGLLHRDTSSTPTHLRGQTGVFNSSLPLASNVITLPLKSLLFNYTNKSESHVFPVFNAFIAALCLYIALISWGCYTKISDSVAKQQTCISRISGGWEVWNQGAGRSSFWGELLSWFRTSTFVLQPHMAWREDSGLFLFLKGHWSQYGGSTLMTSPKPIHLGGGQRHFVHSTYAACFLTC